MSDDPKLVRRANAVLQPDPRRVITRLFLPGQEILAAGISRADAVIARLLALPEEEVASVLGAVRKQFSARHDDLSATFVRHFALVEHRLPAAAEISALRRELIGSYFTLEYAVEAAALFNPSVVAHPDQSGVDPGEVRFIMSLRAVGEGHISSIEFRTGTFMPPDRLRVDGPGPHLVTGRDSPATLSRAFVRAALADCTDAPGANRLLDLLPERFNVADLEEVLAVAERERLTRGSEAGAIERLRWVASSNYLLDFPVESQLSERVLYPTGPAESHGMEDARFTRFADGDAGVTYYATYTAYDGSRVVPHLVQTDDFLRFSVTQLIGSASENKGMALFPRRVRGRYLALQRWDRENNGIAWSPDGYTWSTAGTVQVPEQPWELIQLGNCGPPLETAEGWLVLTHGVGPMRGYSIGAILLDLDNPERLIGALPEPLLTPSATERDGYVPNVVYSCGALLHQDTLLLPYGCSDSSVRFAFIDVPELLGRLLAFRGS